MPFGQIGQAQLIQKGKLHIFNDGNGNIKKDNNFAFEVR